MVSQLGLSNGIFQIQRKKEKGEGREEGWKGWKERERGRREGGREGGRRREGEEGGVVGRT